MSDWIDDELATLRFDLIDPAELEPRKGRTRRIAPPGPKLKQRCRKVLDAMMQKPSLKFPAACRGRAEVKAAYAFLDNDFVTAGAVLAPHHDASILRIRVQKVVLIPQDTTELDVTRRNEVMAGAGPLNDINRVGFHNHVSLALTPERLPLGVVNAKIWARDPVEFQKDADQKRAERRAKAIEEKESVRWREGYQAACRVAQEAPETHIISLADSEGDVYEHIFEAQTIQDVPKASFIVRACQNRALVATHGDSFLRSNHLRERIASTPIRSHKTIEVRERDPKSKDSRKRKQPREARTAQVTVQAARVTLRGPNRPGGKLPDVEVNAVLVSEANPPPGVEPIEWILLSDLPIGTEEEILLIIDYYACRWTIEIYFRVLKSGCKVEESQLETAGRFEPYLALCMIVSWRIMYVMMLGRAETELPCDIAFDDDEWQAVYATVKREPPPAEPPSMKRMVRLIASLGGWLGRKCDGEPGPKAMWVGMQIMSTLALGWEARREFGRSTAGKVSRSPRQRE